MWFVIFAQSRNSDGIIIKFRFHHTYDHWKILVTFIVASLPEMKRENKISYIALIVIYWKKKINVIKKIYCITSQGEKVSFI